jgi:hypothetical protein
VSALRIVRAREQDGAVPLVGRTLFLHHCAREAIRRARGRPEWSVLDWNALALGFDERLGARRLSDWLPHRFRREELERLLAQEPGLPKDSAGC